MFHPGQSAPDGPQPVYAAVAPVGADTAGAPTAVTMADDDATAIADTLERLMRVQFAHSFVAGMKPAQWNALRYFAAAPDELRTVTAFARHRGSTMGTASTTISTLVRKGYLGRGRGSDRNAGLYVTDAGRALLARDPIHGLAEAIAGLDAASRATLAASLPRLLYAIADPDAPRPA